MNRCSCVQCQRPSRGKLPARALTDVDYAQIEVREVAKMLTDEQLIEAECDALKALLTGKNRKYKSAAFNPQRIFSKASPIEQLRVRIDDKLSRISQMGTDAQVDEDTVQDLTGYLVLLLVARKKGLK